MDVEERQVDDPAFGLVPSPTASSTLTATFVPTVDVARAVLEPVQRTVGLLVTDSSPFFIETCQRIESIASLCFSSPSSIPLDKLLLYYKERLHDLGQESIAFLRGKSYCNGNII